jgi:uncharacterized paraquat-inducible protein A
MSMKPGIWWPLWAMVNLAAFVAGAVLPLATVSHFYVFDNDIVLFQVPYILAENGENTLALIVLLLGILFPVGKTLIFVAAPVWPRAARAVGRFSPVSFFDIFMIALLIFVAKGAFASDAATAIGIYPLVFFACSSKLIELAFVRAVGQREC